MANGFNPYSILPINKLGFQSDIEKAQQKTMSDYNIGKWKSKLSSDYQDELNKIISDAEKARKKARKKSPLQKLVLNISKLLDPVTRAVIGGVSGVFEAEQQIEVRSSELTTQISELHSRITTNTKEIMTAAATQHAQQNKEIQRIRDELISRVGVLEKWRHVLIGGSIVVGFLIHKFIDFSP